MPNETQQAVDWALQQTYTDSLGFEYEVTIEDSIYIVDYTRQYFNDHGITYETFSFNDLKPYVEASQYE